MTRWRGGRERQAKRDHDRVVAGKDDVDADDAQDGHHIVGVQAQQPLEVQCDLIAPSRKHDQHRSHSSLFLRPDLRGQGSRFY